MTLNNLANFIKTQSINSIELSSPKDEDLSGNLINTFINTINYLYPLTLQYYLFIFIIKGIESCLYYFFITTINFYCH